MCTEACDNTCDCGAVKCTRRCGEICHVPRCNKRCEKTLPGCGHRCGGLCGEACLPSTACLECLADEPGAQAELYFDGDPDRENEFEKLLMVLPHCGHIVDVSFMDEWIKNTMTEIASSAKIQKLRCPKCKPDAASMASLQSVKRYKSEFNEVFAMLQMVKAKVVDTEKQMTEFVETAEGVIKIVLRSAPDRNNNNSNFPQFWAHVHMIAEQIKRERDVMLQKKDKQQQQQQQPLNLRLQKHLHVSVMLMRTLHLCIVEPIDSRSHTAVAERAAERYGELMSNFVQASSVGDIVRARRAAALLQLRVLEVYMQRYATFGDTTLRELQEMMPAVDAPLQRDAQSTRADAPADGDALTERLIGKMSEMLLDKIGSKAVDISTLREIHEALKNAGSIKPHGAWMRCKGCDYLFTIGDCGGATQEAKCPGCQQLIGGGSHRLNNNTQYVGDIDGSAAPAWPQ